MNFKKPTRKADVAGFTVLVKRVVFAGRPSPESCSPPKDDGQLVYRIFIAADQVGNGELPKVLELEAMRSKLQSFFSRRSDSSNFPPQRGFRFHCVQFYEDGNEDDGNATVEWLLDDSHIRSAWQEHTENMEMTSQFVILAEETTLSEQDKPWGAARAVPSCSAGTSPNANALSISISPVALSAATARLNASVLSSPSTLIRGEEDEDASGKTSSIKRRKTNAKTPEELFCSLQAAVAKIVDAESNSCFQLGYFRKRKWVLLLGVADFKAMEGGSDIKQVRAECTKCDPSGSGSGSCKMLNGKEKVFTLSATARGAQLKQHFKRFHSGASSTTKADDQEAARAAFGTFAMTAVALIQRANKDHAGVLKEAQEAASSSSPSRTAAATSSVTQRSADVFDRVVMRLKIGSKWHQLSTPMFISSHMADGGKRHPALGNAEISKSVADATEGRGAPVVVLVPNDAHFCVQFLKTKEELTDAKSKQILDDMTMRVRVEGLDIALLSVQLNGAFSLLVIVIRGDGTGGGYACFLDPSGANGALVTQHDDDDISSVLTAILRECFDGHADESFAIEFVPNVKCPIVPLGSNASGPATAVLARRAIEKLGELKEAKDFHVVFNENIFDAGKTYLDQRNGFNSWINRKIEQHDATAAARRKK